MGGMASAARCDQVILILIFPILGAFVVAAAIDEYKTSKISDIPPIRTFEPLSPEAIKLGKKPYLGPSKKRNKASR